MRLGRVTRYALLLVPLFVCGARLHAQRTAVPAAALQEANRCLALVRSSSRRRQRNERSQRTVDLPAAAPQASVAAYSS